MDGVNERHYGLRVGDTVEERAFGNIIRGVIFELPPDNNAAHIVTADGDILKVVAEWCVKVEPTAKLTYLCDKHRHLVCVPFSIENLHRMADDLGIKRGWFDKGVRRWPTGRANYFTTIRHPHYDIPKRRVEEIAAKCTIVPTTVLFDVIRGVPYETAKQTYATRKEAASDPVSAQYRRGLLRFPIVDGRDRSSD